MNALFEQHLVVSLADVDKLGHVNNTVYIRWMQDAAVAHSAAVGWTFDKYREVGAAWVARAHYIEYLIPAFEGDEILIRTWVSGFRKVMSWRRYDIFGINNGEEKLLAKGETKWAFADLDTFRPCRVPGEMRDSFKVIETGELLMKR